MNDKHAKKIAAQIQTKFWVEFERALSPENASKQAYADELHTLIVDAQMRLEAVEDELADE